MSGFRNRSVGFGEKESSTNMGYIKPCFVYSILSVLDLIVFTGKIIINLRRLNLKHFP